MTKKAIAIALVMALTAGLLAGCGAGPTAKADPPGGQQAAQSGKREINIAYQVASTVILVAKAKGFYEEEFAKDGTAVKYGLFIAGPPLIEAFAGGRQDVGHVGDMPPVTARASGVDLKIIANAGIVPFSNAIFVPKNSPVASVKDLKGKKVAVQVGSASHHFIYLALQKNGLQIGDINLVNLAPPDQKAALEAGNVDAAVVWEPWGSSFEAAGVARLLLDSTDLKPSISVFIARTDFIKQNPDLIERFLKVNQRTVEYIKKNPEEALALLAKETKLPAEVLRKSFEGTDWNPRITDSHIEAYRQTKDFLKETKVLKKDFDIKDLFETRYLKNLGVN